MHVTDDGRSEILGHLMPMLVAMRELDAGLSESEREVVLRFLAGAIQAFDRVSDPAPRAEP